MSRGNASLPASVAAGPLAAPVVAASAVAADSSAGSLVPPAPRVIDPWAIAALVVANIALAFGPWFVRLADTGPVSSAFWRITLAAPVLAIVALAGGARPRMLGTRLWLMLILAGVSFAGDLGAWHIGILHTTLANATLFGNSATFIFPLYGFLVMRAWPSRIQGLALLLALVGAMLLMGQSYRLDPGNLGGDLLCLLAGLLYTVYFVLMRRARTTLAPLSALTASTLFSIVPLWLFALAMGERILPASWTPLIALALCSQVLGQGLMIYVLGKFTPLVIGIALLIQPAMAAIIGWVAYRERLGAADLAGALMVGVALVLVTRGPAVAPGDAKPDLGGKVGAKIGGGDER